MEMDTATARRAFRYLGITDESDSCDCCGKTGLKRVVGLEHIDSGEVVRYGTSCAARALGTRYADRELKAAAKAANVTLARIAYFVERAEALEATPAGDSTAYRAEIARLRATLPVIYSA